MAASRRRRAAAPHLDKLKLGGRSPLQMARTLERGRACQQAALFRAEEMSICGKCFSM